MMHFKNLFSILFFIVVGLIQINSAHSEKFPIIYVNGKVINIKNKELVKPGDKISVNTYLQFNSDTSFVLAIIENHVAKLNQSNFSKKGRKGFNELSCPQLISETPNLDSIFFYPLFSKDSILIYKTNQPGSLSKSDFQLKENNFLIIQLEKEGMSYSRKLSFSEDAIVLDKPSHFKIDSSIHFSQIKVVQYNSATNTYKEIYLFKPHIISNKEIQKILDSTEEQLRKLFPNQTELINNLQYEVVIELLGVCSPEIILHQNKK